MNRLTAIALSASAVLASATAAFAANTKVLSSTASNSGVVWVTTPPSSNPSGAHGSTSQGGVSALNEAPTVIVEPAPATAPMTSPEAGQTPAAASVADKNGASLSVAPVTAPSPSTASSGTVAPTTDGTQKGATSSTEVTRYDLQGVGTVVLKRTGSALALMSNSGTWKVVSSTTRSGGLVVSLQNPTTGALAVFSARVANSTVETSLSISSPRAQVGDDMDEEEHEEEHEEDSSENDHDAEDREGRELDDD